MRVGDKLICRKKKNFFSRFSMDKHPSFTDGNVYEIEDLNKDGVDEKYYIENGITGESEYAFSMPKVSLLYIVDDHQEMRFLDLMVAFNKMDIFLTESELRKEKLKKINGMK